MSDTAIDQSYYWTPEWQAAEREAEADIVSGRTETFATAEEGLRWLMASTVDERLLAVHRLEPGAKGFFDVGPNVWVEFLDYLDHRERRAELSGVIVTLDEDADPDSIRFSSKDPLSEEHTTR